jgi:putative colanic acid biosynthesis acetyltransferase WcaF
MTQFDQFKYVDTIPRSVKARRLVWLFAWNIAFKTTPRWTCHAWRRFMLRAFGATIGQGCKISPTCFVWAPWNLEMGDYSALGDGVDCYTMARISIGSKVAVSQRSFLCTGTHSISSLLRPLKTFPITIGDHAWIAAESFIHPGINIGVGAVIGARSVVTKDMPSWMVCGGHPCIPLKQRHLKDLT